MGRLLSISANMQPTDQMSIDFVYPWLCEKANAIQLNRFACNGGCAIYFGIQHNLGRPIPSCGHVLRQETGVIVFRVSDARQSEVADLFMEKMNSTVHLELESNLHNFPPLDRTWCSAEDYWASDRGAVHWPSVCTSDHAGSGTGSSRYDRYLIAGRRKKQWNILNIFCGQNKYRNHSAYLCFQKFVQVRLHQALHNVHVLH